MVRSPRAAKDTLAPAAGKAASGGPWSAEFRVFGSRGPGSPSRGVTKISVEVSKFVQLLSVEDFRIESGAAAQPGVRGSVHADNAIRIWLIGQPVGSSRVTQAFLEARSSWSEPALPRFEFTPPRIVIAYTLAAIQPVVSLLVAGAELYCQYREFEGGAVHADVHRPRRHPRAREDPHWVRTD